MARRRPTLRAFVTTSRIRRQFEPPIVLVKGSAQRGHYLEKAATVSAEAANRFMAGLHRVPQWPRAPASMRRRRCRRPSVQGRCRAPRPALRTPWRTTTMWPNRNPKRSPAGVDWRCLPPQGRGGRGGSLLVRSRSPSLQLGNLLRAVPFAKHELPVHVELNVGNDVLVGPLLRDWLVELTLATDGLGA